MAECTSLHFLSSPAMRGCAARASRSIHRNTELRACSFRPYYINTVIAAPMSVCIFLSLLLRPPKDKGEGAIAVMANTLSTRRPGSDLRWAPLKLKVESHKSTHSDLVIQGGQLSQFCLWLGCKNIIVMLLRPVSPPPPLPSIFHPFLPPSFFPHFVLRA